MGRIRITVRGTRTELRGYLDGDMERLERFADAMKPFGTVAASPADDDYNPFEEMDVSTSLNTILQRIDASEVDQPILSELIMSMAHVHAMQAAVIRGERARADAAEQALRERGGEN
jgi:hypothetical protein